MDPAKQNASTKEFTNKTLGILKGDTKRDAIPIKNADGTTNVFLRYTSVNGITARTGMGPAAIDGALMFHVTRDRKVGLASGSKHDPYPWVGIYVFRQENGRIMITPLLERSAGPRGIEGLKGPMELLPEIFPR